MKSSFVEAETSFIRKVPGFCKKRMNFYQLLNVCFLLGRGEFRVHQHARRKDPGQGLPDHRGDVPAAQPSPGWPTGRPTSIQQRWQRFYTGALSAVFVLRFSLRRHLIIMLEAVPSDCPSVAS